MIYITGWYKIERNKAKTRQASVECRGFRYGMPGLHPGPYASLTIVSTEGDKLFIQMASHDFERFAAQVSAALVVMQAEEPYPEGAGTIPAPRRSTRMNDHAHE